MHNPNVTMKMSGQDRGAVRHALKGQAKWLRETGDTIDAARAEVVDLLISSLDASVMDIYPRRDVRGMSEAIDAALNHIDGIDSAEADLTRKQMLAARNVVYAALAYV